MRNQAEWEADAEPKSAAWKALTVVARINLSAMHVDPVEGLGTYSFETVECAGALIGSDQRLRDWMDRCASARARWRWVELEGAQGAIDDLMLTGSEGRALELRWAHHEKPLEVESLDQLMDPRMGERLTQMAWESATDFERQLRASTMEWRPMMARISPEMAKRMPGWARLERWEPSAVPRINLSEWIRDDQRKLIEDQARSIVESLRLSQLSRESRKALPSRRALNRSL